MDVACGFFSFSLFFLFLFLFLLRAAQAEESPHEFESFNGSGAGDTSFSSEVVHVLVAFFFGCFCPFGVWALNFPEIFPSYPLCTHAPPFFPLLCHSHSLTLSVCVCMCIWYLSLSLCVRVRVCVRACVPLTLYHFLPVLLPPIFSRNVVHTRARRPGSSFCRRLARCPAAEVQSRSGQRLSASPWSRWRSSSSA